MEIDKVLVSVAQPFVATRVTLKLPSMDGVPEIVPVEEANESPAGKAPERLKVVGVVVAPVVVAVML